jgi:uncharacterized repeat protein (TIGR03803 family)
MVGGTVFELTPNGDGTWSESTLHGFDGSDGSGSMAGLIFDTAGNLYGTTETAGPEKYGTVFELAPQSGGDWIESVLHGFDDQTGCCPYAGVVMDGMGNLYGTAGWAFELSPGSGGWNYNILHEFCQGNDGCDSYAGVILDPAGNLYGTTSLGGGNNPLCSGGCGIVYQLTPGSGGNWNENILHRFGGFQHDGRKPSLGALTMDKSGNIYGATIGGGAFSDRGCSCGTVFKLTPGSGGKWKETILHSFTLGPGGEGPGGAVVRDKAGNLHGTTIYGGSGCGCGVVYKLSPGSKGKWKYTVLHRFIGSDGAQPDANLILDRKGNLYGTTATGGAGGYGVAFKLTP